MTELRVRRVMASTTFGIAALLSFGLPVSAAEPCSDSSAGTSACTVEVQPVVINAPTPAPSPLPNAVDPTVSSPRVLPSQQLPITGSEAGTLVAAGLVMTAAGFALVRGSRKSTVADR